MNIKLIAHTQLSEEFLGRLLYDFKIDTPFSDGKAVALTAIRTCYSANKPSEILPNESNKYFGQRAKDGKSGTDADRLMRHIVNSGHLSTLEHLTFTFAIEGVSRSLLAQLTRHRVGFSYSVQSQRYVKFGSGDKSGGFHAVEPKSITEKAEGIYLDFLQATQETYDSLRDLGIPAEDARMILPNAATCNLVMTCNFRSLLDFYKKRSASGAQWEIRELAEKLKEEVVEVELWTEQFFGSKEGGSNGN